MGLNSGQTKIKDLKVHVTVAVFLSLEHPENKNSLSAK